MLKRRLSKDLALYGVGDIVSRGLLFLALPIYTRVFSPAEYGKLSTVLTLLTLLVSVLALGADSAFALFYFEATSDQQRRLLTSSVLAGISVVTLIFVALTIPLAAIISELVLGTSAYTKLIVLMLLVIPPYVINRLVMQVLRSQFRAGVLAIFNIVTALLSVGIGLLGAVLYGWGINGIVLGTVLGEVATLPARLYMIRTTLARQVRRSELVRVLSFGLPLIPTSVAYWFFLTFDRILLGRLSSFEQVGLYSVANAAVGILLLIAGVIGQAWNPHALEMYNAEPGAAAVTFGRFLTYILAFMGFLCVFCSAFAPEIVRVFTSPRFYEAEKAVPPLAIAIVAYATTYVTAMSIGLTKQTRYIAIYSSYTAILNVLLCVLLIPRFGQVGAAWATTVAYVALTLMYFCRSQRLWPVIYEARRSLTLVVLIVVFTALTATLPSGPIVAAVLIKLAFCMVFAGSAFLFRSLRRDDLRMVRSFLGTASPTAT